LHRDISGPTGDEIAKRLGSPTMHNRHYGHLARDGREHAIKLLDALNTPESEPWTLVDARWTPNEPFGVTAENEKRSWTHSRSR
jgi:hypothetical protein